MELTLQVARFLIVGLLATAVHALTAIILVSEVAVAPHIANLFAFAVALGVSFVGHSRFTFRKAGHFWRFMATAFAGFSVNVLALETFLSAGMAPQYAVGFATLIAPVLIFILSRLWVYSTVKQ